MIAHPVSQAWDAKKSKSIKPTTKPRANQHQVSSPRFRNYPKTYAQSPERQSCPPSSTDHLPPVAAIGSVDIIVWISLIFKTFQNKIITLLWSWWCWTRWRWFCIGYDHIRHGTHDAIGHLIQVATSLRGVKTHFLFGKDSLGNGQPCIQTCLFFMALKMVHILDLVLESTMGFFSQCAQNASTALSDWPLCSARQAPPQCQIQQSRSYVNALANPLICC